MAAWNYSSFATYTKFSGVPTVNQSDDDGTLDVTETDDGTYDVGDPENPFGTFDYVGCFTNGGHEFLVFETLSSSKLYSATADLSDYPALYQPGDFVLDTNAKPLCFAAGSKIATPSGERLVEQLRIGDVLSTAEGAAVTVKWIGRQTVHKLFAGPHMQPVRIAAGALGDGLPHSDLTVTADHGMIVDGLVINASALVNGTTIYWVPMAELPDHVTYYHIETEAHDVILANGAPAETFCDIPGRMAFDNYQEYLDLYGAERIVPEMDRPRISSRRLLPDAIKARLGIVDEVIDFDMPLSA